MQILVLAFGLVAVAKIAVALSEYSELIIIGSNSYQSNNPFNINANDTIVDNSGGFIAIGAGLAIGLAGAGAGIGLGTAAASAAAAITEKPETFGKLLVLLALIEAIAIYGFVIAFVLAGRI